MLIVNEGLLVAAVLEACDAKGFNAEFKLVSSTARKHSPLVSFSGIWLWPSNFGLLHQRRHIYKYIYRRGNFKEKNEEIVIIVLQTLMPCCSDIGKVVRWRQKKELLHFIHVTFTPSTMLNSY